MDHELQGNTCLVTGASAGIGVGIVRLLVAHGASVAAMARRIDRFERNIPVGRFAGPAEVALIAAFLTSPRAAYITGTVIPVDGSMRHAAH